MIRKKFTELTAEKLLEIICHDPEEAEEAWRELKFRKMGEETKITLLTLVKTAPPPFNRRAWNVCRILPLGRQDLADLSKYSPEYLRKDIDYCLASIQGA